jgi:hypothetical protein
MTAIDWLLDSDPAICWQVMRDLTDAPPEALAAERDHLRVAGRAPDDRAAEAIEIVRAKRGADGRWPLENPHEGKVHVELDDGNGRPSRWNTLRALRVLRWANDGIHRVSSAA